MSEPVLTGEEMAALLRAARVRMDYLMDEIIRLHSLNGRDEGYNRSLGNLVAIEHAHLSDAVSKLWLLQTRT